MQCKSWRIRPRVSAYQVPFGPWWFRDLVSRLTPWPTRCTWPAEHVTTSKWHCAEETTGWVWLVRDKERPN